jgi:hypothetical protein
MGPSAVHDLEFQAELVAHLGLPLNLNGGRANDEDGPHAVAQHKLLRDEAGLNGLTEAHVVGDEEVHARHVQRAHQRVQLVILDFHAAAEWGLKRLGVRL